MLCLRRGIHTRPKKVRIQLLRDFPSVGLRGEVVEVKEGLMRHKLHPKNGAAYVRADEPLRIPLVTREEALRLTRAAELAAVPIKATPESEPTPTQTEDGASTQAEQQQRAKVQSLLDSLSFPTAGAPAQPQTVQPQRADAPASEPTAEPAKKQFEWQNEFVVDITDRKTK